MAADKFQNYGVLPGTNRGDCWIGCGLAGATVTPSDLFRLLPYMMIISLWAAWRAAVDEDILMFLVWKCSSAPAYLPDLPSVALILCSVRQYGLSVRFWLWQEVPALSRKWGHLSTLINVPVVTPAEVNPRIRWTHFDGRQLKLIDHVLVVECWPWQLNR